MLKLKTLWFSWRIRVQENIVTRSGTQEDDRYEGMACLVLVFSTCAF